MSKASTFHFARLNLVMHATDKVDFLRKTLNTSITLTVKEYEWGFFDFQEVLLSTPQHRIAPNIDLFFAGNLVKLVPEKEEDIVDRTTRQVTKISIKDRAVCLSPFFLHPKSGVIAYRPIGNQIGKEQFRRNFARLIEEANDRFFVQADVQVINDEKEFMIMLKAFSRINKLTVHLHPSNPSARKVWSSTDSKMKKIEAETYIQIYKSKRGLQIAEQEAPYHDIIMASDGYGEATIVGELKGKKSIASTGKTQLVDEVALHENPQETLNELSKTFIKIWERMDDE